MLVQMAFGAQLAESAAAAIIALAILAYGGGAYVGGVRAAAAFALGVVPAAIGGWIHSRSISTAVFNALLVGVLPWTAGRLLRLREASAQAQREAAERVDGRRDAEAHAAIA